MSSDLVLIGSYDYRVVALSIVIAVLGSYAALDLGERVTAARHGARVLWLIGGATAMGIGIWSMHYTAMLAFHLPVPMWYDWPTALVSLLTAMFASIIGLFVASRHQMGWQRAIIGSIFMGGSIVGLHYIAMASMRLPAMVQYSPPLVLLSVLLAIILGLVAALRWYVDREAQRAGLLAEVVSGPFDTRLPPELETACFRIVQEALTNVVRHAQARQVWVELRQRGAQLHLIIRDDGIGFDVQTVWSRRVPEVNLGLQGMQERAFIVGGELTITSALGQGTEVKARFHLISSRLLERELEE